MSSALRFDARIQPTITPPSVSGKRRGGLTASGSSSFVRGSIAARAEAASAGARMFSSLTLRRHLSGCRRVFFGRTA